MPGPITPQLVYALRAVSGPTLSPDGRTLVFAQSEVDASSGETRSRLMILMGLGPAAAKPREARPYTAGPKDAFPKFSPDGRHVAFFRTDELKRRQLWVIPSDGGEARALTDLPGGVSDFQWAPDSSRVALVAKVDPDAPSEDASEDAPERPPQVKVVRRLRYRFDTLGWLGDAHTHLFVVGLDGSPPRPLTDGDWDDAAPAWSPDGQRLAFVSAREPEREFTSRSQLYVVDADGGEPELWSAGLSSVANPVWSPAGTRLAAVASTDDRAAVFWHGQLVLLAPGAAPQALTGDEVHPNTGFGPVVPAPEIRWTADDRLLFLGDAQGESFLFECDIQKKTLRKVAGGGCQMPAVAFDAAAARAVAVAVPPHSAGDLVQIELPGGARAPLTAVNAAYFSEHPAARLEKFALERAGQRIQSRVYFPPTFDERQRYPLVVDIHGGPHGAFFDAFTPWVQLLATSGYVVLCVNPRGSSGYGLDFGKAVLGDWGGEDYLDILQAVDELAARPYVDETRMGLHGYSYGGFMSAWIVGQTARFKAAVVGAPCIDLPSFAGTSDIGISFGEVQWGGTRHEAYERYVERSPLTYAPRVETPVLLLHGEADHRCPVEQSEQYFAALKRLGKTVEFVRFPGCSHLFLRFAHPALREAYLARMKDWLDRYLLDG